jgi:uncharacterized protein YbjQ (UPF0145 family)
VQDDAPGARHERASGWQGWTSWESVASTTVGGSGGWESVGEVMGAISSWIGWRGHGAVDPATGRPRYGTTVSGDVTGSLGYRPYAQAVDHAYTEALRRLTGDATRQGADGVVGIRYDVAEDDRGLFEVVLRGTGVRAPTGRRQGTVFTTELDGAQVSALRDGGWAPVAAVWGFSIGVRPTDWAAAQQRRRAADPQEITGYTDLVTRVRADARAQLAGRARRAVADGVLVTTTTVHEPSDLVCEALVRGSAIARTAPTSSSHRRALSIMPLRDRR